MKTYIMTSDTHGTIDAIETLLKLKEQYPDAEMYHLGDIFDGGPDAQLSLELIINNDINYILGNHDELWLNLLYNNSKNNSDLISNFDKDKMTLYSLFPNTYNQNSSNNIYNFNLDNLTGSDRNNYLLLQALKDKSHYSITDKLRDNLFVKLSHSGHDIDNWCAVPEYNHNTINIIGHMNMHTVFKFIGDDVKIIKFNKDGHCFEVGYSPKFKTIYIDNGSFNNVVILTENDILKIITENHSHDIFPNNFFDKIS